MPMDPGKILTMSARDYCEMHRRSLSDYRAVGLHYSCPIAVGFENIDNLGKLLTNFANTVPDEAEAVVDFRFSSSGGGDGHRYPCFDHYASGTALIPKKEE